MNCGLTETTASPLLLSQESVLNLLGYTTGGDEAFDALRDQGLPVTYVLGPDEPRVIPEELSAWLQGLTRAELFDNPIRASWAVGDVRLQWAKGCSTNLKLLQRLLDEEDTPSVPPTVAKGVLKGLERVKARLTESAGDAPQSSQ